MINTVQPTNTITNAPTDTDTVDTTPRRPTPARRMRFAARLVLAFVTVSVLGLTNIGGTQTASASSYSFSHTDQFGFWDGSGSGVYVSGGVNWFTAGPAVPGLRTYRGQYAKGSYVILNKTGCLWAKVSWNNVTGTASWPPAGGRNSVSDGFYRACGPRGTYIWLDGVSYASKSTYGSTICIGYSDYATYELRRHDSCKRVLN